MEPAIRVDQLRVRRSGRMVLDDVSFEVAPGELVGLIGPSGSGKTTLMRSLVGTQVIAGGAVSLLGEPAGVPSLRGRVGYMTQAPSVYSDLTVLENLRYFAAILGAGREEVDRVIGAVDLGAHRRSMVAQLSGGEEARVSLAAALLGSPKVLILDEPTVGLDPLLRRALWTLFGDLAALGAAVVVSSHVMDEAERCGRLLLIREGRLLADGSPADLLRRTGAPDLEGAFIAAIESGV